MRRGLVAGLAGLVVLFILISSTLFTVGQTQRPYEKFNLERRA